LKTYLVRFMIIIFYHQVKDINIFVVVVVVDEIWT